MLRQGVALAALLAVSVPAVAQDPDAEMRFGAGVRLLRDGFPDRALVEIEAALKARAEEQD